MDALKKLTQLHDYVKKNYEQGKYDNPANQDYSNRKAYESHSDRTDDYQMGFSQALQDHQEGHAFKSYPEKLVDFGNQVSDDKMQELSDFIAGYEDGKRIFK